MSENINFQKALTNKNKKICNIHRRSPYALSINYSEKKKKKRSSCIRQVLYLKSMSQTKQNPEYETVTEDKKK